MMVNAAAPVVDAWKCPQNVRCPLELPSHFTWLRIQKRCCCAWKRSMVTCDKTRLWLANIASSIPGTAPPAAAVAALDAPSALWADQHADQPAAPPCCGTVLQYLPPACASSVSCRIHNLGLYLGVASSYNAQRTYCMYVHSTRSISPAPVSQAGLPLSLIHI